MEISNNSDKIEEKRTLNYSSVYSMFALFLSLVLIFYPFFKNSEEIEKKIHKAKVESLAYQVAAHELRKTSAVAQAGGMLKGRAPASTSSENSGKISQDAKGSPMLYEIQNDGDNLKVNVWSDDQKSPKTEVLIPRFSR